DGPRSAPSWPAQAGVTAPTHEWHAPRGYNRFSNSSSSEPTMNGTAGEAVLPQLLGDIYLGRKSGILQLIREGGRLAPFFREGRVLRFGDRENGPPAVPVPRPKPVRPREGL